MRIPGNRPRLTGVHVIPGVDRWLIVINEGTIASYTTRDIALSTARQFATTFGGPVIVHDKPTAAYTTDEPSDT